jgi:DNA-binding NtrC family response regulator
VPEKKKILIVDDEVGILEELKDYLEEEGFEVETLPEGAKAILILERFKPHVLVLDMKLPDISGLEILKKVRAFFPETRVIVSTGYVDQKLVDEADRIGYDIFIQKPFDLESMKKEIDRLL